MKRLVELESKIRDSQIVEFYISWNYYENNSIKQYEGVLIKLVKEDSILTLKLKGLRTIDIYEDEINSQYIGHLKCLVDENNMIWLILDPYDERNDKVEEKDNFKLYFKEYEIDIKEKK